jgi:hypothetical protein
MNHIRGVTEQELKTGNEEVFIDFREKKTGEIVIKLRNLIEKDAAVKNRVKDLDKDHLNILHIFIDTVSRNNFFRKY